MSLLLVLGAAGSLLFEVIDAPTAALLTALFTAQCLLSAVSARFQGRGLLKSVLAAPRKTPMTEALKSVHTRFRAYQLGQAGSSFSYYAGGHFTLIEAVTTDVSRPRLLEEMHECLKGTIDLLHITSWDQDHCSESGLAWILEKLAPAKIEFPGYEPHSECGKACLAQITAYRNRWSTKVNVQRIDPPYIASLQHTTPFEYRDIFYHPRQFRPGSNDNSTIKMFRGGSFNVTSFGDVEDPAIASMVRRCKTMCRETDIMILAHHGADNGFTTKRFLEDIKPSVAICTSNYDNQHDHPRQEIRDLLYEQNIRLFTTKTGDVLIRSLGGHRGDYRVTNLCSDSTKVSSQYDYRARKAHRLSMNADTRRNLERPGFKGLR